MAVAPHSLFAALERARHALLQEFGRDGVTRIEYVVGFVHPYSVHPWLGTDTDEQRDSLAIRSSLSDDVGRILLASDLPSDEVGPIGPTTVQSQQCVDRDYRGNWFYALR
ncbi:MAG: hypothetical protein U0Q22_15200 [Acidimicrobiales bacterium]|mgnify:CR=1 FL=1